MKTMNVTRMLATCVALVLVSCSGANRRAEQRTFARPEDAVKGLTDAVKSGKVEEVLAIFGPDGKELLDTSDQATARKNLEVFKVAIAERWQLIDHDNGTKMLVIGNESWPFPVPLVKRSNGWGFDTAAGKEEVLARRIGRNELAVIRICRTYVAAQRLYAKTGHDGLRAGLYATTFRSDPDRHNGLYWPAVHGQKRSPLGDLVAQAATEGTRLGQSSAPAPFHGYFFRILTAQGADAPGGAKNYMVDGKMSGGFGLVAWPAQYDVTGVMTFVVNQNGDVREKDLGTDTQSAAAAMTLYNPDASWTTVE
jgi:hypothetical protein